MTSNALEPVLCHGNLNEPLSETIKIKKDPLMKGKGKILALILASNFFLIGCERQDQDQPKQALQVTSFEGFHVPGTAAVAKSDGFTQCTNEYSYFKCSKSGTISLLGVTAKSAEVNINSANAFDQNYYSPSSSDVTLSELEDLSYRDIHLTFEITVYDQRCVKNKMLPGSWGEPNECRLPGGIESLRSELVANGWIGESSSKYYNYYKQGIPVRLSIRGNGVDIEPLSPSDAADAWERTLKDSAAQKTSATKSQDFISSMK